MELKRSFKLSLIFLCAAAAPLALAQMSPCNFDGLTAGVGLGGSRFLADVSSNIDISSSFPSVFVDPDAEIPPLIPPFILNGSTNSLSADVHRFGILGRLFVGYGQTFDNHTYVGGEFGLNFFGANDITTHISSANERLFSDFDSETVGVNSTAFNVANKVERNTVEPTLDLKLGFLMTPTALVYLRGGINYNTIKVKSNVSYTASGALNSETDSAVFPPTASATTVLSGNHKSSGIGWRAGIGGEVMVTPNLGVSADYIYTWYRDVKVATAGAAADVACDIIEGCAIIPATATGSHKAKTEDEQIVAQLIYHMGW